MPTKFIHGLRYTCDASMEVVDRVLHEEINADLVKTMYEYDGKPVPLSGKDIFIAEKICSKDPATGESIDLGNVGEIVKVDRTRIMEILDRRQVPVITPVAMGRNGRKYNINADMAACAVAEALTARKLVFLSDVPGIMRDQKDESSLISTIHIDEVEGYIASGVIDGGMVPKIRSAVHALRAGSRKVHMIDGRIQHSLLLEMFTVEGIGTQIVKVPVNK